MRIATGHGIDMREFFDNDQPDAQLLARAPIAGCAIGILAIEARYALIPGNVANASSYQFPVAYEVLAGIAPQQLMAGDPALEQYVVAGVRRLERVGVRAVIGACGSFANYQRAAAAAAGVPVFLSILTQVPFILQGLPADRTLGIVFASDAAFTDRVRAECGIHDVSRLRTMSAFDSPEMRRLLEHPARFSSRALERELVELVDRFLTDHGDIGALLLQCSDLPPYAAALQRSTGLPVFDMVTLAGWLQSCVVRRPFVGFI